MPRDNIREHNFMQFMIFKTRCMVNNTVNEYEVLNHCTYTAKVLLCTTYSALAADQFITRIGNKAETSGEISGGLQRTNKLRSRGPMLTPDSM
ncbi:unnamed protein product [Fusarium graminearum]|uniref:Chromosome 1, complete genome n=1 Tax=Gibberella zeae (strain ATCC MYA-4620 / CBS 123657 / FGSC 9075 / NRRL 31084 / PH-1) TaxID=229533 RepID=A0A0E0RNZ2_GIBZE|nr:hypothetical protein FG05_30373 [Fusarium graminearum]CAG1962628.1 unnamed protein product [Fusarium graminearum]CEF72967.1 unnamed protein product [Fusarium graminearum]CZS76234.1 unnamed protein product [Fusarium graminearum]